MLVLQESQLPTDFVDITNQRSQVVGARTAW